VGQHPSLWVACFLYPVFYLTTFFFKPLFFLKDLFIYLFVYLFIYLFINYMYVHCSCLQIFQKRASDLITDGCEPPCGCWDLNSGPSEEQSVLLTSEPSFQPSNFLFSFFFKYRFSLCSQYRHYEDQVDLKLTEILLPLPPKCWDQRHVSLF
jgi:hypothetical protein